MHSTQTNLVVIIGSSAAAAGAVVILVILVLVVLLAVILVRKANSRLEKSQGSSKLTAGNGAVLDTSKGGEKNLISMDMNPAYAVTTQGNAAYTATEQYYNDYEEYTYI